ncbi:MAG: hypothetical protein BWK77_04995 [Verrucomicrobia bacterium A1]|nr:MAG: hypothetical protein BWK77_04995 [Verrucomicrobia bacterium A1]
MLWAAALVITCILGWIDWQTGFELNFFAFYFLPVGLAAWYSGLGASVIMAVVSSVVWFEANAGQVYSSPVYAVWNTIIRLSSFIAIGWSLSIIRDLLAAERKTSANLRRTLAEIKLLQGLLPICAQCKKIRDDHGLWQHMEVYVGQHSNAQFSHGYCPDCLKKAMEEAGLPTEPTESGAPPPPRARDGHSEGVR